MKSIHFDNRAALIIKAILFCMIFTGFLALFSKIKITFPQNLERFVYGFIGTIVAFLTTWLFLTVEKRSFAAIGLKWEAATLKRFFVGLLMGLAISTVMIMGLIYSTGLKLEVAAHYDVMQFFVWTLAFIPLAFMEELAFRAYPFVNLNRAVGIRITQIIMAVIFALYHVAGGQSLFSALLGPGVWSFVFGLAVILSGGISLPTGLHYGANLILAAIGQHQAFPSIWTIQYRTGITPAVQQNVEYIGTAIQIALLIVTTGSMEWYFRRRKYRNGKPAEAGSGGRGR